jgi:hypothetical protein
LDCIFYLLLLLPSSIHAILLTIALVLISTYSPTWLLFSVLDFPVAVTKLTYFLYGYPDPLIICNVEQ